MSSRESARIFDLLGAEQFSIQRKSEGKTIALCHGVFDLLHPGHISHLEEGASKADVLIVSVTHDAHVEKGPGRPVLGHADRMKMLANLSLVDAVVLSEQPDSRAVIEAVKPDYYIKGPDYLNSESDHAGNLEKEVEAVKASGGAVLFTEGPTMSSSNLINSNLELHGREMKVWISEFKAHHSLSEVQHFFQQISKLKVLIVGEPIIDQYCSVEPLGKTSKDPILAFLEGATEAQPGGSLAIGRHVAGLGASTSVTGLVGNDFPELLGTFTPNFELAILTSNSFPTIQKTRFVDKLTGSKIFEKYVMRDSDIEPQEESRLLELLEQKIAGVDVVIVCDYGHGLLTKNVIDVLSASPGLLCVNTQANAGNRGMNSVSRYPRVDFLSLNGSELALEYRHNQQDFSTLLPDLATRVGARAAVVTEGSRGLSFFSEHEGMLSIPAFTNRVKDRVGAGDALFAATSLMVAVEAPARIAGIVGNLAGAYLVGNLGNRDSLSAATLTRHLQALLK